MAWLKRAKGVPQWLKPIGNLKLYGTAEAMPLSMTVAG
jgi:hypothetical protein